VVQEYKTLGIKEQPVLNIFPLDGFDTNTSTVTEEEITRVLIAFAPVAMQDFVSRFRPRLRTPEVKHSGFAMRFALNYCVLNNCIFFLLFILVHSMESS
jgi:hypothetical protein